MTEMRLIFFHAEFGSKPAVPATYEFFGKMLNILNMIDPDPLRIGQSDFLIALESAASLGRLVDWCKTSKVEWFLAVLPDQGPTIHPLTLEMGQWLAKKGFHPVPLAI
jgi:hypothetical protein